MRILIVIAVLFLLSCSTTKKLKPLPNRTKEEIVQALRIRNIDFEWFSGKMSTSLSSPDENVSGSMTVRMKKDSAILVAIKKFGFEAARLFVDQRGYTLLYRMEKAYEKGNISQINEIISVTASFEDIQQLIFGNVLLPDNNESILSTDSIYYSLKGNIDDLIFEYYVNGYNLQLEKMVITDKMNRTAAAEFADYRELEGFGKVPYERTFMFPYGNDGDAIFNMKFSEIEINVPVELKFSIPENYEKIN